MERSELCALPTNNSAVWRFFTTKKWRKRALRGSSWSCSENVIWDEIKKSGLLRSDFLILKQLLTCCNSIICKDCVVSDANLHKFWKQFTTLCNNRCQCLQLFPMQIYTNFESNSQQYLTLVCTSHSCFRCKFTQILKAIHNLDKNQIVKYNVVSDANLHKFWKQFTTNAHHCYR